MLETQLKSLKVVLVDAERRQAAAEAGTKQLSTGQDLEMKRYVQEISELKQQVISLCSFLPRDALRRVRLRHAKSVSTSRMLRSARAKNLS